IPEGFLQQRGIQNLRGYRAGQCRNNEKVTDLHFVLDSYFRLTRYAARLWMSSSVYLPSRSTCACSGLCSTTFGHSPCRRNERTGPVCGWITTRKSVISTGNPV